MMSFWDGSGPKNVIPRGFKRISSTPSRRHVANRRARFRASRRRCLCHVFQWGQRVRGVPGKYRNLDKKASTREDMLPPGQHKSPCCLTIKDLLLRIKQGVSQEFFCRRHRPIKKSTAEVVEEPAMPLGNIRSRPFSSYSLSMAWSIKSEVLQSPFIILRVLEFCFISLVSQRLI